jgi:PAS domain S-box-containing protein
LWGWLIQTFKQNGIVVDVSDLAASNKKSAIHVLHVDDDPSIREISKQILMDMGSFEIDGACCVDEAFGKLTVGHYDVVVSDYEMPQKDGLQFLKELREQNNDIPFILFTGKGREEVAIKALNLGVNGYFNKQGNPETVYGELSHGIKLAVKNSKSELALVESELKFRTIASSSVNWIYWISPEGSFVFISPSMEKITGYTVEEFIKNPKLNQQIIDSKDREAISPHFNAILIEGTHQSEFRINTKNGETKWISHICNPVFDNEGKWRGRRAVNIDITERKKAEEKSREIENRSKAIVDNSPIGIVAVGMDKLFLSANEAFCKILGYSEDELLKLTFKDITYPADLKESVIKMGELENGKISSFLLEKRYVKKDGALVDGRVMVSMLRNPNGTPKMFIAELEDVTERKQTEEAFRQSQLDLGLIFDAVNDGFWDWNMVSGKAVFSPRYYTMLGYEVGEFAADFNSLTSLMQPSDAELIKITIEKCTKNKEPFAIEIRLKNKAGDWCWIQSRGKIVEWDNEGKPLRMVGTHTDITEQKCFQEAIRKSEEKYRQLVECSTDGIFTINLKAKVTWANDYGMKLLGYSESDLPVSLLKVIPARYLLKTMKLFSDGLRGKVVTAPFDLEVLTKSREHISVSYRGTLLHDEKGKVTGVLGIIRDFREKKKMEKSLLDSEDRFQDLIETTGEFIWEMDSQWRYTYCSSQTMNIWGLKAEEMIGKTPFDVMPPEDREKALLFFGAMGASPKPFNGLQTTAYDGQGCLIFVETSGVPFFDNQGKLLGFRGISRDITERKKAEDHRKFLERKLDTYSKHLKYMVDLRTVQLKDANERLVKSERLAAIGELAGMVGHDLRNPLAGIKNAAYFLKKKGTAISEVQAKEMFETICKALEHSDKIINDLLDYSREMHLELTKHATHTLVVEALRMIQVPDRIQIINNVQEDTLIWVNADKLMRVFINLIKNAVDAIPEKGTLEISSCQTKDCVEISFADTGTGIPEETLQKLFTPLFTTKAQGMGFGLAICKRIIEAHEGNINVRTELNKGTTFTITIPKHNKSGKENCQIT